MTTLSPKFLLAVAVVVFAAGGLAANLYYYVSPGGEQSVACTAEAKLCPDGSAVGRAGPNCEFAACPDTVATTTLTTTTATTTTPSFPGGIAIGGTSTIGGATITVLSLVEDSRCPADAVCVWAGRVRVLAAIASYNRNFTFTLGEPQVVGNNTITLMSVFPAEKNSRVSVPESSYRFTFTVVPHAPATATPPTPGGVYCTQDAMQCPDGSFVGRSGPNCEFICPSAFAN